MSHVAELAFLARALAVEATIGIGRAFMGVVPAACAVEVFPVTAWIVLRLEAFVAGPCLDQRPINGEMLVRLSENHIPRRVAIGFSADC